MRQSSIRIKYRKTKKLDDVSRHGLLASVYRFAQSKGMFQLWEKLPLKMKSVAYSPADKLKTLWASIATLGGRGRSPSFDFLRKTAVFCGRTQTSTNDGGPNDSQSER